MAPPSESSVENELRLTNEAYRSGDLSSAEARVDKLLASHVGRADVQLAKGIIQITRGNQAGGLEWLDSSLRISPEGREALGWAAHTSLNLQRFDEAESYARKLTEINPENARAHYLLANSLRALGRIEEGLRAIDESLALDPNNADSIVTKARLLQVWQMPALATDLYRKAMAIRPTPAAGMELAKMLLRDTTFRYEDLTSDPETTILAILKYLGLEPEPGCFTPEINTRSVLTPSVYQVRQPIHKGSQARWKNYEPWLGPFAELLDDVGSI